MTRERAGFHPEAELESRAAVEWYRTRRLVRLVIAGLAFVFGAESKMSISVSPLARRLLMVGRLSPDAFANSTFVIGTMYFFSKLDFDFSRGWRLDGSDATVLESAKSSAWPNTSMVPGSI